MRVKNIIKRLALIAASLLTATVVGMALSAYEDVSELYYEILGEIFCEAPDDYNDETVIPLGGEVSTMQGAYGFAQNRVAEWGGKAMSLMFIDVYFEGDQIESQRGVIEYRFAVDDGKSAFLAEAVVTVDMESGTSTMFHVWYDARTFGKRTIGGLSREIMAVDEYD